MRGSQSQSLGRSAVRASSVIKGELLNFYCVIFIIVMPWAWAQVCSGDRGLWTGDRGTSLALAGSSQFAKAIGDNLRWVLQHLGLGLGRSLGLHIFFLFCCCISCVFVCVCDEVFRKSSGNCEPGLCGTVET